MPFRPHPASVARRANNAEALRTAGLNPAAAADFNGILVGPNDPNYNKDRQISNLAFSESPR